MKILKLETTRIAEHPNLLWVHVHTDSGVTGLGETFFGAEAVESYIHETAAPQIIGSDPRQISKIFNQLVPYVGANSSGVEMRGNSAIDIALWDLLGKVTGQPIAQLLGGFTRDKIQTYNTCAGNSYMKDGVQKTANYGTMAGNGQYDDLNAFLERADDLAEDLLSEGISAMKIWPFDKAAEKSGGLYIDTDDLKQALLPFEKIRKRVGDRMEIMVEFHSMWQLPAAIKIAKALTPFDIFWHEDPIGMSNLSDLKRYVNETGASVGASETLASRGAYRELLNANAAGAIIMDLSWCGGISEARNIAAMAEAWQLPVAPHDCTGPVVLAASTHLSLNAPNALFQESVRAFHRTWYGDLVTQLPPIENGMITVPLGAGLGLELNPELERQFTVTRRSSEIH
jgi:galactonate dehydratase